MNATEICFEIAGFDRDVFLSMLRNGISPPVTFYGFPDSDKIGEHVKMVVVPGQVSPFPADYGIAYGRLRPYANFLRDRFPCPTNI